MYVYVSNRIVTFLL